MQTSSDPLKGVRRAALNAASAREELEREIVAASVNGSSLRAIASAAGTNHEAVRIIIARREQAS